MKLVMTIVVLCFTMVSQAQVKKEDVLFTVEGEPIKATEFIRVYNKNLDLVKDESQKDVDAYLELFINYQLKVKEARRLELDKDAKYLREFGNYKKQLTKNYMSDNKVTDALVKEAYERTTNDVKASHILVRMEETETDTMAVYNQLLELRERVLKEGYEAVQKDVHNGQTIFAEDLGYFGGFKMVYPFETAAFNTPVGEVSMPFRTRFGYHIVQVFDKRQSLGEVTVAHIMVSNKQKDSTVVPEKRIQQIYTRLQKGEKFESLAKQFSDDKNSSQKGGALKPFTGGQLSSKEFEDVAFSLKAANDVSQPFQTDYGWHIVKLIRKKGIQPFDEVEEVLKSRVKRDSRSRLINSAMVKKLMSKYNVVQHAEGLAYFEGAVTNDFFNQAWKTPEDIKAEEPIITIGETLVTYKDFADHLMKNQRKYYKRKANVKAVVNTEYDAFLEAKILKYREDNLEFENEDFAFVLKEYRDGLLLFDLMEQEVWNAASKDSVGLQNYYETNRSNYVWKDRVDAVIFSSASEEEVSKFRDELLKSDINIDEVYQKALDEKSSSMITTKDVFEKGNSSLPTDFVFTNGPSKIYNHNDSYIVIYVKEVLPSGYKTLEEARGKIVSDYQGDIEENWVKSLNDRYEVKIDKSVLKRVKRLILK